MKKKEILFILLLLWSIVLGGCKSTPIHIPKTVSQIDISGTLARQPIQQQYTDDSSMQAVLNYLRSLEFEGFTSLDPTILPGDDFSITLRFSDNSNKVYRIHGSRYLCRPDGNWEKVDPKKANLLLSILHLASPTL